MTRSFYVVYQYVEKSIMKNVGIGSIKVQSTSHILDYENIKKIRDYIKTEYNFSDVLIVNIIKLESKGGKND